jgi:hypothetical protein
MDIPDELARRLQEAFREGDLSSITLLQEQLEQIQSESDDLESEYQDFFGLSAPQLHTLLYGNLDDMNSVCVFSSSVSPELLETSPILSQAVYLMSRIMENQEVKATQTGNLPMSLVRDMYSRFYEDLTPIRMNLRSEMDCGSLHTLRILLTLSGLVKIRKKKYSLTKRGSQAIQAENRTALFKTLFVTYLKEFNWAYEDYYPDLYIIQTGAFFGFYLLNIRASEFVKPDVLSRAFVEAFPLALDTFEPTHHSSPEETMSRCFELRFILRCAERFGFIEKQYHPSTHPHSLFNREIEIRTTPLYHEFFTWKL